MVEAEVAGVLDTNVLVSAVLKKGGVTSLRVSALLLVADLYVPDIPASPDPREYRRMSSGRTSRG